MSAIGRIPRRTTDLRDVSDAAPTLGETLLWDGNFYTPGDPGLGEAEVQEIADAATADAARSVLEALATTYSPVLYLPVGATLPDPDPSITPESEVMTILRDGQLLQRHQSSPSDPWEWISLGAHVIDQLLASVGQDIAYWGTLPDLSGYTDPFTQLPNLNIGYPSGDPDALGIYAVGGAIGSEVWTAIVVFAAGGDASTQIAEHNTDSSAHPDIRDTLAGKATPGDIADAISGVNLRDLADVNGWVDETPSQVPMTTPTGDFVMTDVDSRVNSRAYTDNAVGDHDADTGAHADLRAALADRVLTTDGRLSDTRTPTDGTVTLPKFAAGIIGAANGIATLGSDGKVPSGQLPASSGVPALDDLTDVTITSPTAGQSIVRSGSEWVNGTPPILAGPFSARPTASASLEGVLYWATDVYEGQLYICRSSVWQFAAPPAELRKQPVVAMIAGSFTTTAFDTTTRIAAMNSFITSTGGSRLKGFTSSSALSGTSVSGTNGVATITGVGTSFTTELSVGQVISTSAGRRVITAIASNTSATVDTPWGTTWSSAASSVLRVPTITVMGPSGGTILGIQRMKMSTLGTVGYWRIVAMVTSPGQGFNRAERWASLQGPGAYEAIIVFYERLNQWDFLEFGFTNNTGANRSFYDAWLTVTLLGENST